MWSARSPLRGHNAQCPQRAVSWTQCHSHTCGDSPIDSALQRQPCLDTIHFSILSSSHLPLTFSQTRWLLQPEFLHLHNRPFMAGIPMPHTLPFLQDPGPAHPCLPDSFHTTATIPCPSLYICAKVTNDLYIAKSNGNSQIAFSAHHSLLLVTISSQVSMASCAMQLLWAKGNSLKGCSCDPLSTYTQATWRNEGLSPDRGSWAVSTRCLKLRRAKTKLIWCWPFYFQIFPDCHCLSWSSHHFLD